MRRCAPCLALMLAPLLGGCNREPDFDERYATAEKAIREKAAEMDAELAERERQASEAASPPSASAAASDHATSLMNAAK